MQPVVVGNYHLIKLLGEGSFGRVYLGKNIEGKEVAVKVLNPIYALNQSSLIHREYDLAKEVNQICPNTVKYLDNFAAQLPTNNLFPLRWQRRVTRILVLEYLTGMSMDSFIVDEYKEGQYFDPLALLEFLRQLAIIVQCLHSKGVVHGDINMGNVFFDGDHYILIDFGGSCRIHDPRNVQADPKSPGQVCEILTISASMLNMLPELSANMLVDRKHYLKNPVSLEMASQYYLSNDVYAIIMCGLEILIPNMLGDHEYQVDFMAHPYTIRDRFTPYLLAYENDELYPVAQQICELLAKDYISFHEKRYLTIEQFLKQIEDLIDLVPSLLPENFGQQAEQPADDLMELEGEQFFQADQQVGQQSGRQDFFGKRQYGQAFDQ